MKPIARQLIIGAFILALVTAASLGIRQVRFSIHRTRTVEGPVTAETEPDVNVADSPAVTARSEPKPVSVAEPHRKTSSDHQAKALASSGKGGKISRAEFSKVDSTKTKAKGKGTKGSLERIPLGDHENLYITPEGRLVYVGKGADGQTVKMEVQIDDATGEMTVVSKAEPAKSAGSKTMQKIPMGGNDNVYITEEGQAWYVSDGSKTRVQIDDASGEVTVVEQFGGGK